MNRTSQARFAPTRWSLVRRARKGDEYGRAALAELCATYWPPVYAFFRRDGMAAEDARDLTQGLFAELLERGDVAGGDPERGRFRSYLLACARHYRSNRRDRERAQKRGGGTTHVPIRIGEPEEACDIADLGVDPPCDDTPERVYTRSWIRASVAAALRTLEAEERAKGRGQAFEALRDTLDGERPELPYAVLGRRLGCTEAALKVAVHRLRKRFRATLLRELGATLEDGAAAEAELQELLSAIG